MKKISRNKKGALELSIGTIVIIVIAMSMLILGLILVRNIFFGATQATELINQNVKAEINKLFNDEGTKTVVYLPGNQAELKKGKSYNVRFAIRNTLHGQAGGGQFTYTVEADEVESGCQLSLQQANNYIVLGQSGGPISILPGEEPNERIIKVRPSENAPLCAITYNINVKESGQPYHTNFFIIEITG